MPDCEGKYVKKHIKSNSFSVVSCESNRRYNARCTGGKNSPGINAKVSGIPLILTLALFVLITTVYSAGFTLSKYMFNYSFPISVESSENFITAVGNISGTPQEGQTLTAGALTPSEATALYQWQRCASSDGTYLNISGATSNTYIPVSGDVNYFIRVVATGTGDYAGFAASVYTGPIISAAVPLTAIGSISGTAQVGLLLTAGSVTPSGATATYQWKKCATSDGVYTEISGAASNTYTPVAADYNYYIKVSATGIGSYTGTVTSTSAGPVATGVITAIGNILGTTTVDQALTAGALTPAGASASYQWMRSSSSGGTYTNISGATSNTYTLVTGDYNYYFKVTATGTGPAYSGSVTSAYVGPVTQNPTPVTAIADISGTAQVGSVITAGSLTPSGATATYQWIKSSTSGGTYTNITGATSSTYTLTSSDYNSYIKVVATGSGPYTGSVTSAYTGPVAAAPITGIGSISGVTEEGAILTAGTLSPAGATAVYQWMRSSAADGTYASISGATYGTYTLAAGDVGYYIKVSATGTNGYSGTVTSSYAGPVIQDSTPITAIGSISGTVQVGSVLTAGTLTPSGATAAYQWLRSSSADGTYSEISGAASNTYTPVAGDYGYYIKVRATGNGSYSGTVTSAYTGPVAAAPLVSIGNIAGSTQVGSILTAGTLSPAGATAAYQWMRSGSSGGTYTNISGATSSTYTLTSADRGSYIKVAATGSGSYTGTVTSAYTGPVVQNTTPITAIGNITGTAQVGSLLTAGALTPSGATATYQWQRSASAGGTYTDISGATSNTYTPVIGDYNYYIKVTATGSGLYEGTVTSSYTGPVTSTILISISNITGTAQIGSTLSAGSLTPPGASATYQWQRSTAESGAYADISGATGSTYSPVSGDTGYYIKVVATGSGSYTGTVTSNYIGPVVSSATPLTAIGNISGTAKVDNMLTAGSLTPSGATATYQWQRSTSADGTYVNISGATSNTYTPTAGDLNYYIKVTATGTGSYSGTVTSNPAGPVAACTIYLPNITGITAPVKNATPDTTVDETSQYTATITWSPSMPSGKFQNGVVYTATITIAPKTGYTLTGVAANYFTVSGATSVTNSANSGVVTAVFPAAQ